MLAVPLRGARSATDIRKKIALFASPADRGGRLAPSDVDNIYKVPLVLPRARASTTSSSTTSASRRPRPTSTEWGELTAPRRRGDRDRADRARRQVRPARGRLPVGRPRRCATPASSTARRSRSTGSTPRRSTSTRGAPSGSRGADGILDPRRLRRPRHRGQDPRRAGRPRAASIPYLGICLGMQIAVAEFARHVAGMDGANSTEFDPETPFPVIDLLPEQKEVSDLGGTMRLGADPVKLHDDTRARELYGEAGHLRAPPPPLRGQQPPAQAPRGGRAWSSPARRPTSASSRSSSCADHPFFVASQYHPEFKSRPERPAPLFREFVGAALERARERASRRRAPRRASGAASDRPRVDALARRAARRRAPSARG